MNRRMSLGVAVLLAHGVVRHPAAATAHFTAVNPEGNQTPRCWVVGASLKSIDGNLPTPAATYILNGRCEIDFSSNDKGQESTFDKLKVVATIEWTAQGTYQPEQKNTREDISLRHTYLNRPGFVAAGTLSGWMICAKDPWREPDGLPCGSPGSRTAGTVDPDVAAFYARNLKVPQTSNLNPQQRAALKSEYDAAVQKARQVKIAAVSKKETSSSAAIREAFAMPSVVSPAPNQSFRENTSIPIKLTSPKSLNAAGYLVNIETKNPNGTWRAQATIPVGVAEAQSAAGYTGFGAGAPPAFLALPGSYRLNARVSSPKQSEPSAWVEFTVNSGTRAKKK